MNTLETFRRAHGLTYRELTRLCGGLSLNAVYRHCKGRTITAESAVIYAEALRIPRSALRPDLWPPEENRPRPHDGPGTQIPSTPKGLREPATRANA